MRKLFTALLSMLLILGAGAVAYAQTGVSYTENTEGSQIGAVTVDWTLPGENENAGDIPQPLPDGQEEEAVPSAAEAPAAEIAADAESAAAPDASLPAYPLDVETLTENDIVIVRKTYRLPPGADPAALVEPFERDGCSFTLRDILAAEQPGESLSRPAVKVAVASTGSDDRTEILTQFPASIDHEEDGFSGRLTLDASSLVTEPEEYETYSYPYTETETLGPLGRNDPSLLEKERQGMTLAGISFEGRQESQAGDSLVPSSYGAAVTWRGTATGKRPVSYVTTATYTGELTRTDPGSVVYTYVYAGTPAGELRVKNEELRVEEARASSLAADSENRREAAPSLSTLHSEFFIRKAAPSLLTLPYEIFLIILPLGMLAAFWRVTKKEREARRKNLEAFEEIARFIRGEEQ